MSHAAFPRDCIIFAEQFPTSPADTATVFHAGKPAEPPKRFAFYWKIPFLCRKPS